MFFLNGKDGQNTLERQINNDVLASYYIGKYYFRVNTRKLREEFGLVQEQPITMDVQRQMQSENLIALFHEYFHYIHEISTMIGNVGLSLDLTLKSIFSHYFSRDLNSSIHLGVNNSLPHLFEKFAKIYASTEVINGAVKVNAQILEVKAVRYKQNPVYVPLGNDLQVFDIELPVLTVTEHDGIDFRDTELVFGKFFCMKDWLMNWTVNWREGFVEKPTSKIIYDEPNTQYFDYSQCIFSRMSIDKLFSRWHRFP